MGHKKNIGLLIIATNKYTQFVSPLIESADKHFFKNHNVTYFVFTNKFDDIEGRNDIIKIDKTHEQWPLITLGRYKTIHKSADILSKMDYLFYCDADMLFVDEVGDEILPDENSNGLVGTIHPGFFHGNRELYSYETNPNSTAYISPQEGVFYYAGGFNGGTTNSFLTMAKTLSERINKDLENNIIAVWHDESQMNRYMVDNPPKSLSSSYCYPENWNIPFERKLLALDKNHEEVRN